MFVRFAVLAILVAACMAQVNQQQQQQQQEKTTTQKVTTQPNPPTKPSKTKPTTQPNPPTKSQQQQQQQQQPEKQPEQQQQQQQPEKQPEQQQQQQQQQKTTPEIISEPTTKKPSKTTPKIISEPTTKKPSKTTPKIISEPTTKKPSKTTPTIISEPTTKPSKGGKKTTPTIPDVTNPPQPAIDVCLQNANRRNQKDYYPDVTECHHYYQCFYFNQTYALGYRRRCPEGQFWHDIVLSCMPEGDVPCVDQCLDSAIAARGWYAGTGCRQYFFCSNTGSNGMCCPVSTEFNLATGGCDFSESCTDECVQLAPPVPTTVAPSDLYNSTVCQDSFGTYIYYDGSETNAYWLIDVEGHATEKQYCPDQVSFELATCRCNIDSDAERPVPTPKQRVLFFDPFNPTVDDVSVHKFKVFLYDGAYQDWEVTINPGRASLNVNGGRAEAPGLAGQYYGSRISIAGHFRCAGISSCTTGTIMSNNKDAAQSEYTFIAYVQAPNTLVVKFSFWAPVGAITLQGNFITPADTWNKFAASYDGNTARLYINGAQADSQNIGGLLSAAHTPLVIGDDPSVGTFNGYLDSIIIATWAFNNTDQLAVANDDGDYMIANGWAEPWWYGGGKM